MKRCFLFLLILFAANVSAQEKHAAKDFLKSKIALANAQIEQRKLADAEKNAQIIVELAKKQNDKFSEAVGNMFLGQANLYSNQQEKAIPYFEAAINNYFSKHDSPEAALAYNDYAYTWGELGNLDKKTENLLIALRINERIKPVSHAEMATVLGNLSTTYLELRQTDKAIEYAKKSLENREKSGDVNKLALGYCNMCQMYRGVDSAEAENYRNLCIKYAEKSKNEERIIQSYISSALLFSDKKNPDSAMVYEQKAIGFLEKTGSNPAMLSRRYLAMAMHTITLGKDSATVLGYLDKSRNIALQNKDKPTLREINFQYYTFYKKEKNFETALEYYRNFMKYRDSVITENTNTNIAELETKYQTEKKDYQIKQLSADQKIKQLQIQKQNAELAGNKLLAAQKEKEIQLLSQEKELQELRINQQKKELERQQLTALSNKQKLQIAEQEKTIQNRKLRNSTIIQYLSFGLIGLVSALAFFLFNRYQLKRTIKEQQQLLKVRENIAKDLHDEIGSTLTSIKILSEVSDKTLDKNPNKVSEFLHRITEQSVVAQQGISDIVWSVKPENDSLEQMVVRMREYAAQTLENKNIVTKISIDEKLLGESLDMLQRRDFLMIFKEAVNNIAKYADATEVNVSLEKMEHQLCLKIADNGKGFDAAQTKNGNGLHNMKTRAEAIGAGFRINSEIGKGTAVELVLDNV
ncbi:MAG: histidine kinase [Edaphocola sp.]